MSYVRGVDRELSALARRFLIRVVPLAAAQLQRLRARARRIPNSELRHEALSSIASKDFHVHGGCILATFLPPAQARRYVRLVAAFETAVDYLDNLCDRAGACDEDDFRALHESLLDAVDPTAGLRPYFRHRECADGGYLNALVTESQELFASLRSYDAVMPYVREVTARYCELQVLKHLKPGLREQRCADAFGAVAADMEWWEGAAACGSTMPTFALAFGALQGCDARRARELYAAYFPYVSALHILLDYFIDQAEDRDHGELNFVACYPSREAQRMGISRVGRAALARTQAIQDSHAHSFALRAMCGFYCTRRKVREQSLSEDATAIAAAVDVDIGSTRWHPATNPVLAPLLSLYRRMIRV